MKLPKSSSKIEAYTSSQPGQAPLVLPIVAYGKGDVNGGRCMIIYNKIRRKIHVPIFLLISSFPLYLKNYKHALLMVNLFVESILTCVPIHQRRLSPLPRLFGQALTRLVTVSSMCYHTSTSALSTSSSSRGFTSLRMGYLILRGASRLDAFSVYPFRTWLPGHGFGKPTGPPAVRPSRSSRTKDSSSQISYAHAG